MDGNLNQYRIFYTVAKVGNISHAAENLYISQPAISKAVSKLEEELKTSLFVRKSRGVTLTEEGRILYEHLNTAFDAIFAGEEKIRQINTLGIGQLKIGASATLCKYVLLPYLKGFIEKFPHIKISIECQSTYHTLKLLEGGRIDIALVVKPSDEKKINFFKAGEVSDIFAATKSY
ncbi:MAG: LysR family transcriptional regulator, partial [Oscillospiraceae bacterium]